MSDTIKVSLNCKKCGAESFHIPDDPKPDDMLTCNGCGAQWRYDVVRNAAIQEAKSELLKIAREAFKKRR